MILSKLKKSKGINIMEQIEYEYAGFWIRMGASIIDLILISIFTLPITMIIYEESILKYNSFILGPTDFLINWVLPALLTILFWIYKSATPGKMILNIKVLNEDDGKTLTAGQALGRYLAYALAVVPFFLGILWIAFDKKKQGWHDRLARTVVVRNKKSIEDIKFNKKFAKYKKINYDEITEIDNLILEPLLNEIGFELSLRDEVIEISSGKIYKILKKDNKIYFSFNGEIDYSIKAINV